MRTVKISFDVQVPDLMTPEELLSWVKFNLSQEGCIGHKNPMWDQPLDPMSLTVTEPITKVGDQVLYLPVHAKGDPSSSSAEYGFVTSFSEDGAIAFCRYWESGSKTALRTQSCSEATRITDLLAAPNYADQTYIDGFLVGNGYRL